MNPQVPWARAIMDSLRAGGCERVIASPGSRSTPLLLAAIDAGLSLHTIIDERAAAFFALGLVRATAKPVALLCTSGSAAGHYMPAVMEASADSQPLVVISSDRPPELHGSGANQTTDQARLFGGQVRSFVDLGTAILSDAALRGVVRRCRKAVLDATFPHAGPVHINVPLRKPLEGRSEASTPQPKVFAPSASRVCDGAVDAVVDLLSAGQRPAIVAGPADLKQAALRPQVRRLAELLGAPVLADLTSQLHGLPFLDAFDADVVLQLGRPPIDSGWDAWSSTRKRAVVTPGPWLNPSSNADLLAFGELDDFVTRLATRLESKKRSPWAAVSEDIAAALAGVERTVLGHASVARLLSEAVPSGGLLMAGNSLSVRHLDLFGTRRSPGVLHQRGLSGIDGLVAGAAGAAGAGQPVGLMLGDISLLHDIKSLGLTPPNATLVVVVINDQGGRIFERLPVAQQLETVDFEEHFATAHAADFEKAAAAFGAKYARPTDVASLVRELSKGFSGTGTTLVEVRLPKDADAKTRAALQGALQGS